MNPIPITLTPDDQVRLLGLLQECRYKDAVGIITFFEQIIARQRMQDARAEAAASDPNAEKPN